MSTEGDASATDVGPVFVVGAGPSGMTAALRLQQQGFRVVVLEKRDRSGGMVHTHREAGYLMEEGATILPSAYSAVLALAREVGVADDLIPAGSKIGFVRDGTIHNLRSDHLFLDAVRTGLVSTRSKLAMARLGLDAVRASRKLNYEDLSRASAFDTETPRQYCERHAGLAGEVYDYVVDSTVRGVLGVRGDAISNLELYFMLYNILGTRLYAFRHGYSTFMDRLAARLDIRLGVTVQTVIERADRVEVTWTDATGTTRTEDGAGAVITARGDTVPDLAPALLDAESQRFLRGLRYTKCVVMNTGVTRRPAGITASVINVPRTVDEGLMGFTCEHNKAPGRAPEGHGLMALLTMTEWAEQLIDLDDDTVRDRMLAALEKIIPGVADTVDYTRITRWNEVIVYSRPGLYRELGEFQQRRPRDSRIQLGGVFFSSSNMSTATVAGERAVSELVPVITRSRRSTGAVT